MQNRYVGDIGDFGKLGLLRQLSKTGLSVGVNWYLTPDETHNGDGRHIGYLESKPIYFDTMKGGKGVKLGVMTVCLGALFLEETYAYLINDESN